LYTFLEVHRPGSFYIDEAHNLNQVIDTFDLIFYSFVTLTTLGYGDITPITSPARALTVLEAITGVFYLAIFIARLVGSYQAHPSGASFGEGTAPQPTEATASDGMQDDGLAQRDDSARR
jgi:hypothetical protein